MILEGKASFYQIGNTVSFVKHLISALTSVMCQITMTLFN